MLRCSYAEGMRETRSFSILVAFFGVLRGVPGDPLVPLLAATSCAVRCACVRGADSVGESSTLDIAERPQ